MVKSGKDLDWVVEQLVQGKKIQKKFGSMYNFDTQNQSKFSRENVENQNFRANSGTPLDQRGYNNHASRSPRRGESPRRRA